VGQALVGREGRARWRNGGSEVVERAMEAERGERGGEWGHTRNGSSYVSLQSLYALRVRLSPFLLVEPTVALGCMYWPLLPMLRSPPPPLCVGVVAVVVVPSLDLAAHILPHCQAVWEITSLWGQGTSVSVNKKINLIKR
jgi:hypothetical protein